MNHFRVSPRAKQDLDEIWLYIAEDNVEEADKMMDAFHAKFRLLASQPILGKDREDLAPALRFFPVGKYLIFYRAENGVDIYRVLQGNQLIGPEFFNE